MTDRELMQQALEALEGVIYRIERDLEHGHEWAVVERDIASEAIAALRDRLAQSEQEPVAWRYDLKHKGSFEGVSTEYSRIKLDKIGSNWTPLYTAPQPAQQPLTDEQIAVIAAACGGLASDFVVSVARAIEAAHGIGETK